MDLTGIGYTLFEPSLLEGGELQSSAAVTHIKSSNYVHKRRLDSLIHSSTWLKTYYSLYFQIFSAALKLDKAVILMEIHL